MIGEGLLFDCLALSMHLVEVRDALWGCRSAESNAASVNSWCWDQSLSDLLVDRASDQASCISLYQLFERMPYWAFEVVELLTHTRFRPLPLV